MRSHVFKAVVGIVLLFCLCSSVSAQPIRLKFAHNYPPHTALPKSFASWAEKVMKDSNGRVEITIYGPGLIKPEEFYDAVVGGVTDIAYGMLNQDLARFGLDTGLCLAGLNWPQRWPNVEARLRIHEELRKRFPIIRERQKDVVVLYDVIMAPFVFHSPKKAVRSPKDIKGLRVAATGWYVTLAKILGAAPVAIPGPERYMALQRGVVEGSFDLYAGIFAMKLIEVTNNYLEADFGDSSAVVIMNRKRFESLPADIQKILLDNRDFGVKEWLRLGAAEHSMAREEVIKRGQTIITPTEEERKEWESAMAPLREEWIKQQEERGFPARAFMDELLRLVKSVR